MKSEIELLKGAIAAQDERERQAGERCNVPYELWGCDWPDAVAEVVLHLRTEVEHYKSLFDVRMKRDLTIETLYYKYYIETQKAHKGITRLKKRLKWMTTKTSVMLKSMK